MVLEPSRNFSAGDSVMFAEATDVLGPLSKYGLLATSPVAEAVIDARVSASPALPPRIAHARTKAEAAFSSPEKRFPRSFFIE